MARAKSRHQSAPDTPRPEGRRQPAWTIGLLLAVPALAVAAWFCFPREGADPETPHPSGANLSQKLAPIRIGRELELVDALPIGTGSLADCSLLLVTLDTTRADRIGCYGNQEIETPTLDGIADDGALFSAATAVAPTTLPAHASILTGLYPAHHGVRANGLFRLEDSHETLAERLRSEGFRTGAVVSAFVLASQFGLSQGFEQYEDDLSDADDPAERHYRARGADRTTDRAINWVRAVAQERFFLWVHYFDPHHDYSPPSPFAEKYAGNLYDGEIAYVDSELKRLLASLDDLGLSERCLVVVVGDHGEGLGQHHEYTHAYLTYDSTLRVPLLMRCGSRLGGGVHCSRPVSQVDVMPTVLSLLGVRAGQPGDGTSLTEVQPEARPVFFESLAGALDYGWEPLIGARSGGTKCIRSSSPELYDLLHDPWEENNLHSSEPAKAAEMEALLAGLFGPELELATRVTPTVHPSPGDLEDLQALGYLGGGAGNAAASPSAAPPQEMIQLLNRGELALAEKVPL
ncbi:MAG: sulfatase, partial [Planctomycetota bacterium]